MALRTILKDSDPLLRKKSKTVTAFNERLWELLDDMHQTLKDAQGAGLAAPQVGVLRRVILVINPEDEDNFIEVINPEIVKKEGVQDGTEGCLSVPGVFGYVERPMYVEIKGQDRNGSPVYYKAEGFQARAFCHETDHLEGHIFTDFVSEYLNPEEDGEEEN